MEIKLLLKEGSKRTIAKNFRTGTLLAQGGAPRGQSAYEQAVEGGYEGTKSEFEEALATGITTISENITDVNTVADNIADINTVADNISDVHTVAENIADVNTIADNITDINTVAGISSDVTQVSSISNAVQTVSNHDSEVTLVATNMANVVTTASNIGDVNTVAGISTDVSTVAGNNSNVTAVAGNATNINAVANNASNVNTVASNISDVNTVATNISDISNVNDNLTIIQDVSENMDDVIAAAEAVEEVLPHITEINNVSDNISEVVAVANDLTNIDNASTYATNAANSAANASTSATNAATSATNAQKWAEGTDAQVQPLGGTKSAKGWAQRAQEIAESIGAIYKPAGSIAFASLPALSADVLGNVYNITDAFTTTADFVEDAGNNYPAGTNVAIVDIGTGGSHSYKFDVLSGFVDLSAYRTAAAQDVIDSGKQATLVSGTNIKTVNGTSLLGSGDVPIDSLPNQTGQSGKFLTTDGTDASWANVDALPSQTGQSGKFLTTDGSAASWANIPTEVDNKSVTLNSNNEIQTVGVIDQNDTSKTIKTWTGTQAQYDSIATKDTDTIYNVPDDAGNITSLLEALYPVGSIYISTNAACPLSTLISGSGWVLVSSGRVLQGADLDHVAGTTIEAGLPNITGNLCGLTHSTTDGAFTAGTQLGSLSGSSSGGGPAQVGFSASDSNAIYGNSTTVQPPAYVVNIFRRIS